MCSVRWRARQAYSYERGKAQSRVAKPQMGGSVAMIPSATTLVFYKYYVVITGILWHSFESGFLLQGTSMQKPLSQHEMLDQHVFLE